MPEIRHDAQQAALQVLRNCILRMEYVTRPLRHSADSKHRDMADNLIHNMKLMTMTIVMLDELMEPAQSKTSAPKTKPRKTKTTEKEGLRH
jgi:hypothetical protein